MKRTVYKRGTMTELSCSPITKAGEVVFSRINIISDPNDPREEYIEELTPDSEEAFKVLRFLDEMNGIGWTPRLRKLERELRDALMDLACSK